MLKIYKTTSFRFYSALKKRASADWLHNPLLALGAVLTVLALAGCSAMNPRLSQTDTQAPQAHPIDNQAVQQQDPQEHAQKPLSSIDQQQLPNSNSLQDSHESTLSKNTLYDLLIAEIAGQRQLYEVAQDKYTQQAQITQSTDIAARATQIALYRQDYLAAERNAELWQQLAPQDPYAYQALAEIAAHKQQWARMGQMLDQMLTLDARLRMKFMLQKGLSLASDAIKPLINELLNLQMRHPTQPELKFVLAHLYYKNQEVKRALSQIEQLIAQDPEHYPSHLFKARALAATEPKVAVKYLSKLLKTPFIKDKSLNVLLGRLLINLGRHKEAEQIFAQLSQAYPREGSFHRSLGLLYIEMGDLDRAKITFETLLALNQRPDEAHYYLGTLLAQEGKTNEALHHFFLVHQGREFLSAQNEIAILLTQKGKIQYARMHLSQMRQLRPKEAATLYLIEAELLDQQKLTEAAFHLLNEALKAMPKHSELLYTRAMVAAKIERFEILEQDLSTILANHPNNTSALNALGYTLADRTNRSQEALQLIERAFALDPEDPTILDSLGWVHYRLGDLAKALKLLKQAYESLPNHEVAAHLGEVLWIKGHHKEAKHIWKKGLTKAPDSKILRDTLQRLLGTGHLP